MDKLDKLRRSENMRRIKSKNTKAEIKVRELVRRLGYIGYRLHRTDLPGKPDLAWVGRKVAIYVHGCFWHAHDCDEGLRKPKSNQSYWLPKLMRNKSRDTAHVKSLSDDGWKVLTVWECELLDESQLIERLSKFLKT